MLASSLWPDHLLSWSGSKPEKAFRTQNLGRNVFFCFDMITLIGSLVIFVKVVIYKLHQSVWMKWFPSSKHKGRNTIFFRFWNLSRRIFVNGFYPRSGLLTFVKVEWFTSNNLINIDIWLYLSFFLNKKKLLS